MVEWMVELWMIEDEPDGRRAILAQAARHCDTSSKSSGRSVRLSSGFPTMNPLAA